MLPDELEKRLDGIEDASKKGYPVRNLYKIACEPGLWLQAYVNIRANAGALTQGVSTDTIDGFSIERAEKLAKTLRSREYVAKPVRRVQIPKKDGKTRPLGIPGGDDKLAQEVARIILERVYEPVFSEHSHGFRPKRSCETALRSIRPVWNGVKWIVDVDIKGFFDNIPHKLLLNTLAEKIYPTVMSTILLPKTQHLVVFQEVIRSGSIGSAAKELGLTQPAVSKIINDIEDYFGVELVVRKNTGVTLTPAGQLLLSRSESITREMKNMVNEISGMSSEAVVEVSFGFPSLIGFTFMSGMINKFKEVFPKAQVYMYEAQLSSFLPAIRDGRLDFAIGTLSAEMKLQDLHVEPLFESEFVLVASKSRTCTGTTTLESLKNEQWVLPQTNMGYYSELLTTLQRNGISIENIVKTDSVVTIYNLVLNADFLTVIPCDMTSPFGSNQFITIPVEETLPVAQYAAVWSKNYRIKKAASVLVELAKEYSSYNGCRRRQLIEVG
ncbi:TPA: transcriptional regulator TdcA [Escherichia coli]